MNNNFAHAVLQEYESRHCQCEEWKEETGYRCVGCGEMICQGCYDAMEMCSECYWNAMEEDDE